MLVPHDMLLMLFYYSAASAPNIKAQERQKLVVERHSNAHVFDSYLYVVNDRFHLSSPPFKPIFYTMDRVAPISSAVAASRALIERPYSREPQVVGAVYDRPGFFVQSPSPVQAVVDPVALRLRRALIF